MRSMEVKVDRRHLVAYGYEGTDTIFEAVKYKEDDYSGIYNLIDSEGNIAVQGVYEEDLKIVENQKG